MNSCKQGEETKQCITITKKEHWLETEELCLLICRFGIYDLDLGRQVHLTPPPPLILVLLHVCLAYIIT